MHKLSQVYFLLVVIQRCALLATVLLLAGCEFSHPETGNDVDVNSNPYLLSVEEVADLFLR